MAEIAKIKGYDIRDKKLAEATSQSTVAATDAIEMKTTSGDQVYIARDSFVQAMASVLNSNSQSTISQLFGADTNGNHAAINTANLKTLLRVPSGFRDALISNINAEDKTTIPNSAGPGVLFYEYGEILKGPIFFKNYHVFDETGESYGGRTLHIKRETAGANVVFAQEGYGVYYGGNFIFIPLRGA